MKLKGPVSSDRRDSEPAKRGDADDDGGGGGEFIRSYKQPPDTPTLASMQLPAGVKLTTASRRVSSKKAQNIRQVIVVAFFVIGLIVCVTSLICILLLPSFVTNQIAKRLVLKNNSLLLDRWSKPNVPMYFKVWVFDVKNAQEIVDKRGTKPKLKEIGPFVFHLRRQKDIVSFAGDNLYYTERRLFHFSPELSCCAINTTVTIPNIPLVAVVDRALSYNLPLVGRFIPRLINRAIQSLREQLFVRKQVGEILFDGYDVELLKMVSRVGSLVGMPQTQQRFAILKGRNDTWRPEQDGVWAINTGARDRRKFGKVSSWNSYKQLPFWASPGCNQINGSDGTLFPPPIRKEEPLYVFNQELCRTVNLVYERPSDIHAIKAYRYVLNPLNFAHTMPSSAAPSISPLPPRQASLTLRPSSQATAGREQQRQPNSASGNQQPQDARGFTGSTSGGPPLPAPAALRQQQQQTFQPYPDQHQQRQQAQHSLRPTAAFAPVSTRGQSDDNRRQQQQQHQPMLVAAAAAPGGSIALPSTSMKDEPQRQNSVNNGQETSAKPTRQDSIASAVPAATNSNSRTRSEQEELVLSAQALGERKSPGINPQTCFCDRKSTNLNGVNVCEFDGLIELSKCTKQAQVVFGSMPHFYQSDPRLTRQVVGLEPNASKHTTYLDIEPNTGLVLGGKRRVQLNLIVKRNNEVEGFENINDMMIPVVWFEESALIPEETAQKFKTLYTDRIRLVNLVLSSLFLAAFGLLLIDLRLMAIQYSHYFHKLKISTAKGAASGMAAAATATGTGGASASDRKLKNRPQRATSNSKKSVSAQLAAAAASAAVAASAVPMVLASDGGAGDGGNGRGKGNGASYERYFSTTTSGHRSAARLALGALNLPLLTNKLKNTGSTASRTQEATPISNADHKNSSPTRLADNNGKLMQFFVHYNNSTSADPATREGGAGANDFDSLSQTTSQVKAPQRVNFGSANSPASVDSGGQIERQPAGSSQPDPTGSESSGLASLETTASRVDFHTRS